MADLETLVIRQSPWKTLGLLLIAIAFVAGGVMMLNDPDGSSRRSAAELQFWAWVCILFFGLGACVFMARLIWPGSVELTSEGFTMRMWHRKDHFPWRSVRSFYVWSYRGGRMAAWRLHDEAPEFGTGARISRSLGADGGLGGAWDRSPEAITALLQAWKDRYAPEADEKTDGSDRPVLGW